MAVHHSIGRISFCIFALSLVVWCGVADPARAHYRIHPDSPTAAGPQAAELAGQAARRVSSRATEAAAAQYTSTPAAQAAPRASVPFESGAKFTVQKDAEFYIISHNIPEIFCVLEGCNAGRPNHGRVQTKIGVAIGVPGLLDIARQALRSQSGGAPDDQAYMLTDAMRDAIWRNETAARLWAQATPDDSCAADSGKRDRSALATGLSFGLDANC